MTENSSAGLVMLGAEVTVTVTREEHHQTALARYALSSDTQRVVAVELTWCTITAGKYRGQPAIEVRLDGSRVGELTHLMSQRYAAFVTQVTAHGGRAGCEALIQRTARGLEVILRLPRPTEATMPIAPVSRPVLPAPATPRSRIFSSHRPAWIAAGVVGLIFIIALANSGNDNSPATSNASLPETNPTTTTTQPTTTTPPPATSEPTTTPPSTTTVVAPPLPPPPNPPAAPPAPPKTTTTRRATPPPPPPATSEPQSGCHPSYTPCVPIASDVDCAGGTGNGPAYVHGPIQVIGPDVYDLDRDGDGIGCE